ncbi:hypothetical protein EYF80_024036 [Liparis tanakae]|uniref:Uncharacterized protein n=1 Tax=Liparis tanakae TaxID=230148 RepID=A0A4Z2HL76_9TELE|nr:hypothetical protein EYF80_024036 [Liparis tanakae]
MLMLPSMALVGVESGAEGEDEEGGKGGARKDSLSRLASKVEGRGGGCSDLSYRGGLSFWGIVCTTRREKDRLHLLGEVGELPPPPPSEVEGGLASMGSGTGRAIGGGGGGGSMGVGRKGLCTFPWELPLGCRRRGYKKRQHSIQEAHLSGLLGGVRTDQLDELLERLLRVIPNGRVGEVGAWLLQDGGGGEVEAGGGSKVFAIKKLINDKREERN